MEYDIRDRLLRRDYLYNDAAAYRAGVEAALQAMSEQRPADDQALAVGAPTR